MNRTQLLSGFLAVLWISGAFAATQLYDMGTRKSGVDPSFTRVTKGIQKTRESAFGWTSTDGLQEIVRVSTSIVRRAHRDTVPELWTTPLIEDAIIGSQPTSFVIPPLPSEGTVAVICGMSRPDSAVYFDFTVGIGSTEQRVLIEGGQVFRVVRLPVPAGTAPIEIRLNPRNVFAVAGIVAWTDDETEWIEKDILYRFSGAPGASMPPDEWAKWKQLPAPDPGVMPTPSAEEISRGFMVFARHYLNGVYPADAPRADERPPRLRIFATPGEYEPFTFTIRPLRNLSNAQVRVTGLGPVTASDISVRRVRYSNARLSYRGRYQWKVVPDILERFESLDLSEGVNQRFWITVHVPDTAPAGEHTGRVSFSCSGGSVEIPVTLKILPFTLREDPSKLYGIYYKHPYDLAARATEDVSRAYFRNLAEMEHADMAAHGVRSIVLHYRATPPKAGDAFSIDADLLQQKLDLAKKYGFYGPMPLRINIDRIYQKHTGSPLAKHAVRAKKPPEGFSRDVTALVRAIEGERVRRGWPEFLYYPVDEPSATHATVQFMVTVMKACKEAGVRTFVTADRANDGFKPMTPYVDVWCMQPYSLNPAFVRSEAARGVESWTYPNYAIGANDHTPVSGARMVYGFGFWQSGYRAVMPWIYSSTDGDPYDYLDGERHDFLVRHEPDGTPVPITLWEGAREGWDDYRYIHTLQCAIRDALADARPERKKAARAALEELASIQSAMHIQPRYKYDNLWIGREYDMHRWRIARQIMILRDIAPESGSR